MNLPQVLLCEPTWIAKALVVDLALICLFWMEKPHKKADWALLAN
jgi:hypothetical protein